MFRNTYVVVILCLIIICGYCKQNIGEGDRYYNRKDNVFSTYSHHQRPTFKFLCHTCYRLINDIIKNYYEEKEYNREGVMT